MREELDKQQSDSNDEQEIDLLELARKLWDSRRLILKVMGIGLVVGLVVAFSIPKEYTTTIKLAPEFSDGNKAGGGLGALASMAGLSTGSTGSEAVQPMLYPDIVSSVPFTVGLFDVPVTADNGKLHSTVRQFLEEETSAPWWGAVMGLPGTIIGGVKSIFVSEEETAPSDTINMFNLSRKENDIVTALTERVSADVDTKTSIITLTVTMQDPMVSAMLADTVAERLKAYVTSYRTNKAREDLKYAKLLNDEAQKDYYEAQQRYADYMDKNQGIVLRSGRTEQERLQNESALAFNLYNTTSQRLQAAKAKVQEITPVYTVLQPATVPLRPSKPSKALIFVGFIFLAAVGASAWVLFGRDIVHSFKHPEAKA